MDISPEALDSWYKAEDVIQVKVSDIQLTEPVHARTTSIDLRRPLSAYAESEQEKLIPIALRKQNDGTYSLVTGIQRYFVAKILGWEHLPAVLTDLSHEAFVQAQGWVERSTPVRGKK